MPKTWRHQQRNWHQKGDTSRLVLYYYLETSDLTVSGNGVDSLRSNLKPPRNSRSGRTSSLAPVVAGATTPATGAVSQTVVPIIDITMAHHIPLRPAELVDLTDTTEHCAICTNALGQGNNDIARMFILNTCRCVRNYLEPTVVVVT